MNNLENLKLPELNAEEMKGINGGSWIGAFLRLLSVGLKNRETVKQSPGEDPYYP